MNPLPTNEPVQAVPLRDQGELLLARGVLAWSSLRNKPVRDFEDRPMQVFEVPRVLAEPLESVEPASFESIPRIIWSYWGGDTPPDLIARCFANWHSVCSGFDIRVLNEQTVLEYIPEIPAELDAASAPKLADWIRLELLRRHGGIWVDASTILTRSLDWVIDEQVRTRSEFVGYFLERYTVNANIPVVESWFLAAPKGSRLIADFQHEFTTRVALRSNEEYVAELQAEGVFEQVRQNIDIPYYLCIHLAMQYVMQTRGGYRLALARAEDGPYLYHEAAGWSRGSLKIQLMLRPAAKRMPPLVKLRKPDRKRLHLYIERTLLRSDSIVGRFLYPPYS